MVMPPSAGKASADAAVPTQKTRRPDETTRRRRLDETSYRGQCGSRVRLREAMVLKRIRRIGSWAMVGSTLRGVELWLSPCVSIPPEASPGVRRVLLCPANVALSGASAPYFPRGWHPTLSSPLVGSWQSSGAWCGMEAGEGMLYPSQCVDGVVGRLGGASFRADLQAWLRGGRAKDQGVLCPVGEAVSAPSPAASDLHALYPLIVHTATPTWPRRGTNEVEEHRQWEDRLFSCYQNGFSAAAASHSSSICRHLEIVSPLLGAGTKGAPVREAARVAANAVAAWLLKPTPRHQQDDKDVANIRVKVLILVQSEEVGEAVKGCLGQTLGESDSEQR